MLGHLALFAVEAAPDLADVTGWAIEGLAKAVTRRLIAGATSAAVESLPGVGGALMGGIGQMVRDQVRQQVGQVASSLNLDSVRTAITEEMARLNLALVPEAELAALRAVARAARGDGPLDEALAALAQAQGAR